MTFYGSVSSAFTEFSEGYYDFIEETFSEHLGSSELMGTYIKSLKKLEFVCDASDIRSPLNDDFNPGPYVLLGVALDLEETFYSLVPCLGRAGGGNMNSILGVVGSGLDVQTPSHYFGFRSIIEKNPQVVPFQMGYERTQVIGEFTPPTSLKGFTPQLSQDIILAFLEALSYSLGYAVLASGLDAFEKERNKTQAAIKALWKDYIVYIEEVVAEIG